MKEFWNGFAAFIKTFWANAAKQGFSIMLLIITNVGFIFWINNLSNDRQADKLEHKAEIADLRNEYRLEISRLRVVIDSLRTGLDNCHEALIRAESEKAALIAVLKQKR